MLVTAVQPAPVMTSTQRGVAKVLCFLTIILAILDQNIVSSAIVPIVRDLDPAHGVEHVSWLVAVFTLAATVVLPLYGKFCDTFGVKRVFIGAVATFLVGSALCGAAQSMTELIAFRGVQGIGAGGLMSVTMVLLSRLVDPDERGGGGAKAGLMAGFGMAIGPYIGGLLADSGGWRWIFYINLPLGIVVLIGALWAIRLPDEHVRTAIDVTGAALAAVFAGAVLMVCEWGGGRYAWMSPQIVGLALVAVIGLTLFIWRQSRAAEPILPLTLFRIPAIRLSYAIQGLVGVAMVGTMTYLMVYLQVIRGVSASGAGAYLMFWAAGLVVVGLVRFTWSTPTAMVAGTATVAVGLAALAFTNTGTSLWAIRAELFVLGLGFGQLLGRLITVVQVAAPRTQLGTATTGIRFFQSLGGAIGAAGLGSVLTAVFRSRQPGVDMSAVAHLPAAMPAFVSGVDVIFAVGATVMALAAVLAARLRP